MITTKCRIGKREESFSKIGYIALTGKVTPAKVAPNEPNIEMKLMIIGRLGYIEKRNIETEHVAIMKRIQMIIGIKTFELRLKSMKLNISILANMAMMENIMT